MKNNTITLAEPYLELDTDSASSEVLLADGIVMYEEDFIDSSGQALSVTSELMKKLALSYKKYLKHSIPEKLSRFLKGTKGSNIEPRYKPIIFNHDTQSALNRVGDILDLECVEFFDEEENKTNYFLKAYLALKDSVIIEKVKNKLLKSMSIGFTLDENDEPFLDEISFVLSEAVPGAAIYLSKFKKNKTKNKISKKFKKLASATYSLAKIDLLNKSKINLNVSNKKLEPTLLKFVEKGHLSPAAKKALYYQLCEENPKTQNIVLESLQLLSKYPKVEQTTCADFQGAARMEELLITLSRGEPMSKDKNPFNTTAKKSTSSSHSLSNTDISDSLQKLIKLQVKKKMSNTQDDWNTMYTFLSNGKTKAALKLASERSEKEVRDMAEEDNDIDMEDRKEEIEKLIKKVLHEVVKELMDEDYDDEEEYEDEEDDEDEDEDEDQHIDINIEEDDEEDEKELRKHRKASKHRKTEKRRKTAKDSGEDDKYRYEDEEDDEEDEKQMKRKKKKAKRSKKDKLCHK